MDFNCLFDKVGRDLIGIMLLFNHWISQGLTFDKPELVPFRLTQNMVDAFGAYGYNGMSI